jgi:hypothetical protein
MEFSPSNLGVIICTHVHDASRPVLLIAHGAEGWDFVCGRRDHEGADDFHLVGVGHLIDRDPSLNECADLPLGFAAERPSVGSPWVRIGLSADEA